LILKDYFFPDSSKVTSKYAKDVHFWNQRPIFYRKNYHFEFTMKTITLQDLRFYKKGKNFKMIKMSLINSYINLTLPVDQSGLSLNFTRLDCLFEKCTLADGVINHYSNLVLKFSIVLKNLKLQLQSRNIRKSNM
jgi:hypothetical protein